MKLRLSFYLTLIVLTGCARGPHVEWEPYTAARFDQALASGKPVIADFYAAWCGPCMIMKETTFRDPKVVQALSSFVRLKADMSYSESKDVKETAKRHKIYSFPTVILFDSSGHEVVRLSFSRPEEFVSVLQKFHTELGIPDPTLPQPETAHEG